MCTAHIYMGAECGVPFPDIFFIFYGIGKNAKKSQNQSRKKKWVKKSPNQSRKNLVPKKSRNRSRSDLLVSRHTLQCTVWVRRAGHPGCDSEAEEEGKGLWDGIQILLIAYLLGHTTSWMKMK